MAKTKPKTPEKIRSKKSPKWVIFFTCATLV